MHVYLRQTVLPAMWQAPVRVWRCRNTPCLREPYSAPNQCSCLQTEMLFQQHLQQELSLSLQRIGLCPDMLWFFERTHTQFLSLHLGEESFVCLISALYSLLKGIAKHTQQKMPLRCLKKERHSWQNFPSKITLKDKVMKRQFQIPRMTWQCPGKWSEQKSPEGTMKTPRSHHHF